MRDTKGKRKGKSVKTESFIHCVLNSYIFFLFHCLSPDFSFQRLRKASFSYPMAMKIHDCCLAPSMSFLATLLLLQPMPLSLPAAHLDLKARISAPGGNMGTRTSLNPHSWWFKSCCFCSVHISFSHPILTAEINCLGHTWLFSENLRMNCYTWCRDLNHTIRILFWTFAQLDELISQERDVG